MIRQHTPPDPDLVLAQEAREAREDAQLDAALAAPVVMPRRREPVQVEPGPADASRTTLRQPFSALLGAAGSGKTFYTKGWAEEEKGLLLCATTGIAAINLGGETINSVLGYFDTASLQEKYINGALTAQLGRLWKAGVRRLVLDEVSMLAGDQLTYLVKAIEEVNGRGYVLGKWAADDDAPPPAMGLTLVGDFCQLAPVKAPYAFESPEWDRFTSCAVTLTEIRRQSDPAFIEMLRAARAGRGAEVAAYFGDRQAIANETDDHYNGPTIVARNESVDRYNGLRMAQLKGHDLAFPSSRWGKHRSEWGQLEKPKTSWGIPEVLPLKIGALVMILANRRTEEQPRRLIYVNGDLGTVIDAEDGGAWVRLQRVPETVFVEPVTRQVKVPCDSARRAELRKDGPAGEMRIDGRWEIVGEITYLPLRVAYASTVHKSQGLSLDRVQVNIRDHFFKSAGMLYVALSRSRTAAGLRLVGSPATIIERVYDRPAIAGVVMNVEWVWPGLAMRGTARPGLPRHARVGRGAAGSREGGLIHMHLAPRLGEARLTRARPGWAGQGVGYVGIIHRHPNGVGCGTAWLSAAGQGRESGRHTDTYASRLGKAGRGTARPGRESGTTGTGHGPAG